MDRRDFLLNTSSFAASSILPGTLFAQPQVAIPEPVIPNKDTVFKFNPDGTRRPFAGNTVICHLPAQCRMRDVMSELHSELQYAPYHSKLGLTSVESYHMTIFPGANDLDRDIYGWPSYVPKDATIEECTRMVGERMAQAKLACRLPIRMRVDAEKTANYRTALSLRMVTIDAEEEKKLRSVRNEISRFFGFRLKDHDTYQFHVTMSYQMSPFTTEEREQYHGLLTRYLQRMIAAQPVLELGNPEFCSFPDMFRFTTLKLLACS